MNSISFRDKAIIKTAVAKQKFIQDLIQKYGEEIIKPDFGLVNRYYERANLKSVDTMSAEYVDMINSLPDSWPEVKSMMDSEVSSRSSDATKTDLISLGLKEGDITNREVRAWLEDRYIKNKGSEVHPIDESVITVNEYISSRDGLLNKIKVDDGLKKELEERGFTEDKLKTPLSLSVDDMVSILNQYKYGGETTIRTVGVEVKPEERVGKIGEWNIWLPHSQETSAKIAGYDETTKEPKTTWCTNRTKGSNLFYHYISRDNIISFLFYIIKDNPTEDNDWLSIGLLGNKGDDANSLKIIYGKDGGMTVNRANKGLFETDFYNILGESWEPILKLIRGKISELGVENPATKELQKYADNVSLFKKELWNKSEEEKKDFCSIILQLKPIKEVEFLCNLKLMAPFPLLSKYGNHPMAKDYLQSASKAAIKHSSNRFINEFGNEPWAMPYLDLAFEGLTKENPSAFLRDFIDHPSAKKYIPLAVKNKIDRWGGFTFLYDFGDKPWAAPYIDDAINNTSKSSLLDSFSEKEWMKPYLESTVKHFAENNPMSFLRDFSEKEWAIPYLDSCAKVYLQHNPIDFVKLYIKYDWAKPYIIPAIELGIKESPCNFLLYLGNTLSRLDDKKHYLEEASIECIKINPGKFLRRHTVDQWAEPYLEMALNAYNSKDKDSNKIETLSSALSSIGLKKEAYYILNLK